MLGQTLLTIQITGEGYAVSDMKPEEYAKVGKEWPLSVSEKDVERANKAGVPTTVYPETFDPTVLSEARGLSKNAGYVGIPLIGGTIDLDSNPNLDSYDWRGSYDDIGIVDQMVREDPVAQAIRLAWTLPLLSVQWSVQPASNDPKDIEIAEFVQNCLFEHMRGGWLDFLEQAVQFTWRGLAAFEIVARYDKELGATVIDSLAPRLPWTIDEWQKYPDGRYGFTQFSDPADPPLGRRNTNAYQGATLSPDKLVLFRFQPEGDNPEPMGILRPAYASWRQRRTYLKLEATGYERSAYGIPTCTVDPGANPGDVEQVNIILRELRAGIRAFAMFPKGFNLEWTECPMKADAIRHARVAAGQDMARAALCQFLFTGESAGAYSLIQGQLDHYTMALQQAANSIATTMSQGPHAIIKRLVNWNYSGVTEYPYIQAGEIRVGDPKQLVEAVKTAVDAGVVTPDDQIEAKIRDVLSLPQRVDNAARPIDVDPSTGPGQNAPVEPGDEDEPSDASPPEDPPPSGGEPSTSSRGEQQAKQEEEVLHECNHGTLALDERVKMDIFIEGPNGRDVREVEKCVRYSEVNGVKDEANQAIADTVTEWRNSIIDDYSSSLAEEDSVEEMLLVPIPRTDELEALLIDELREVYNKGKEAVDREIERQEKDPSLRAKIEDGEAQPRMEGDKIELAEIDFSVPAGVKAELKKGLKWHEEGHSGDGLMTATVSWARRMASGDPISRDKAIKMRAWLARHAEDKKGKGFSPGEDGFPSPGRVAWALWGGDAAVSWSAKLVRQIESVEKASDGQPTLPFDLAEPVKAPTPLDDEDESYIDDIDPEEAIANTAANAARDAAERVQRVAISTMQSAGVGGAVPPAAVGFPAVAAALAVLSVGVDFRLAQQMSNLTYGLGRAQELRSSDARRYIYSNLAESRSCGPCEDRDGDTFSAAELPIYATPAVWCVAGPMCNCLVIGLVE
jgi:hypothetical protein